LAVATDTSTAVANSSIRIVAARNGFSSTYCAMRWCAGVNVGKARAIRSEISWPSGISGLQDPFKTARISAKQ
jgi:hypothetical protein